MARAERVLRLLHPKEVLSRLRPKEVLSRLRPKEVLSRLRPKEIEGTRLERQAAMARRRGRVMLAASVVFAAVVLVAWFPAGALLAQQRTITQASSMLTQLRRDDRALAIESKKLSTQAEIARIARQQFGMVPPGALAYQVLPPPGSTDRATDPNAGDLGNTAVVSPSASAELPPGSLAGSKPGAGRAGHNASNQPGLLTRLLHTLEFWR